MRLARYRDRVFELARFYQAAVINTVFGISAYALLVWLGVNLFVAQALAHVLGVAFNYFTYSRYAFRGSDPAKIRFIVSYGVNYLVSLLVLLVVARAVSSPYLAGIGTALIVSIGNYFALRRLVFRQRSR